MSTLVWIAYIAAGIVAVLLFALFKKPVFTVLKLLLHSAFGWAGLYIFNKIFAAFSFSIGINIASATIAGVLGLPGVLMMVIVKLIYNV